MWFEILSERAKILIFFFSIMPTSYSFWLNPAICWYSFRILSRSASDRVVVFSCFRIYVMDLSFSCLVLSFYKSSFLQAIYLVQAYLNWRLSSSSCKRSWSFLSLSLSLIVYRLSTFLSILLTLFSSLIFYDSLIDLKLKIHVPQFLLWSDSCLLGFFLLEFFDAKVF